MVGKDLKPFTSDGCSVFPDGNLEQQSLWVNCCIRHDLAYWKGGTYEERLASDQALELIEILTSMTDEEFYNRDLIKK